MTHEFLCSVPSYRWKTEVRGGPAQCMHWGPRGPDPHGAKPWAWVTFLPCSLGKSPALASCSAPLSLSVHIQRMGMRTMLSGQVTGRRACGRACKIRSTPSVMDCDLGVEQEVRCRMVLSGRGISSETGGVERWEQGRNAQHRGGARGLGERARPAGCQAVLPSGHGSRRDLHLHCAWCSHDCVSLSSRARREVPLSSALCIFLEPREMMSLVPWAKLVI